MKGEGWSGWSIGEGTPRALWKLALFAALFLSIFLLLLLLLPTLAAVPDLERGGLAPALLVQAVLALAAALLATWILVRRVEHRTLASAWLAPTHRLPLELAVGLAAGVAGVLVAVAVLAPAGVYRFVSQPGTVGGWAAAVAGGLGWLALPAAAEEVVFRGYPLRVLAEGTGVVPAVLITSGLFTLVHGANPGVGPIALANIFLAGVLLAVAVLRTGSVWFATAVHLGWNWAGALLLDLPVSGLDAFDPPLYDGLPAPGAPAWLSGGAFGPEGGLAGTVAALLVLASILWLTRAGRRLAGPAA